MTGLRKFARPATKLMEQLKYSKKITLVFGILLLPLSLSLFFLNSKLAASIDITQQELMGLKIYPQVLNTIIDKNESQAKVTLLVKCLSLFQFNLH